MPRALRFAQRALVEASSNFSIDRNSGAAKSAAPELFHRLKV